MRKRTSRVRTTSRKRITSSKAKAKKLRGKSQSMRDKGCKRCRC
ncbi:MAG: hypothetical protein V1728_01630 [Candidatus Micrarchaeota archaeon]